METNLTALLITLSGFNVNLVRKTFKIIEGIKSNHMAESLTLHGAKDIKAHRPPATGGKVISRINPKRGGDTHMIKRWWGGAGSALYEPCILLKVARTAGEIRLAIPITESTRLTISYDGADDFTFSNVMSIDRVGVLGADMKFIQEYRLPHIVGGKQMKVTPAGNTLPGGGSAPAPATPTLVTPTITGNLTATASNTENYVSAMGAGATSSTATIAWTSSDTAAIISTPSAVDTDISFSVAGTFNVTVTYSDPAATPTSVTATISVVVSP